MSKTKVFVLIMCMLIVCMTMIAGCSDAGTTTETSSESSSTGTTEETADVSEQTEGTIDEMKTITLVSPQVGNSWWALGRKGFEDKCAELGYEAVYTGGDDHSVEHHLEAMETVLVEKPDAIITMAIEPTAYDTILGKYKEADIPVITFYSDATSEDLRLSYIGCDYDGIAEQEIQEIIEAVDAAVGEAPMLGVLVNSLDQTTHMLRPEIYQQYMDDNNIGGKILVVEATGGSSTKAAELLESLTLAYPEMNALMCVEGESGAALGQAYKALGLADKNFTLVVNGDQEEMINSINDGAYGTMTFDVYGAGAKAVEVFDAYFNNQEVESEYIWPGMMVTAENMEEIKAQLGFE